MPSKWMSEYSARPDLRHFKILTTFSRSSFHLWLVGLDQFRIQQNPYSNISLRKIPIFLKSQFQYFSIVIQIVLNSRFHYFSFSLLINSEFQRNPYSNISLRRLLFPLRHQSILLYSSFPFCFFPRFNLNPLEVGFCYNLCQEANFMIKLLTCEVFMTVHYDAHKDFQMNFESIQWVVQQQSLLINGPH